MMVGVDADASGIIVGIAMLTHGIKVDDRNYTFVEGEDLVEMASWMCCE